MYESLLKVPFWLRRQTCSEMERVMAYNYAKFSTDDYDLGPFQGPAVGKKAPDFAVVNASGETEQILNFKGDFLVLEMGSITCPLFQTRLGGMAKLVKNFPQADFAVLYVREAHPGKKVPQHNSMDAKMTQACALRDEVGDTRRILVDSLEGEAHLAFGSYPNAVFIINKNGCIVFLSDWNDVAATGRALQQLVDGKDVTAKSMFKPALLPVAKKTFERAGKGSGVDFFKGLPHLFWNNMIKRNLRELFGKRAKVNASTSC